jgi:nicotinamide-nucleotide amidase
MVFAEILTIGDELCRGEIVDTNSSFLAAELWDRGVICAWMTSCRDERPDVVQAMREAAGRATVVLVSGGLGPTEDDLTVDAIAEVAGVGVTVDDASLARMKERFERARYSLTPNNLRQVRVPVGADVLSNSAGIAPGFAMTIGSATFFVMPGVPRELKAIFHEHVAQRLPTDAGVAKVVLRVFGMGESHIDHRLAGLAQSAPGITVHYQVSFPETLVKVVVRGDTERLPALVAEARRRLGDVVYGEGKDTLPEVLGRALVARGATVALAESCTGGLLGALLTDVPGSSRYVQTSWVTYANESKIRELGVRPETLAEQGAVSEACVREMARGARERAGATYGVAISGIAGPDGGTPDKPVGTVHIAVAGPSGEVHKQIHYPGARDQVRRLSAYWAMALLLREVKS